MEASTPERELVRLNGAIQKLLNDHTRHELVRRDWRQAALESLGFTEAQKEFVGTLPAKSVDRVQEVVRAVISARGRIFFQKDADGDAELMAEYSAKGEGPADPLRVISLKICKFDANFRNCKWIWQK